MSGTATKSFLLQAFLGLPWTLPVILSAVVVFFLSLNSMTNECSDKAVFGVGLMS